MQCHVNQTDQGIKNLMADRAGDLGGSDPDYAQRDLFNAIGEGNFPSWTLYIQVMTFEEAEKFRWNPFDLTKVCSSISYVLGWCYSLLILTGDFVVVVVVVCFTLGKED